MWDSRAWAHYTASNSAWRFRDEPPPTLGVREPRRPSPPTLTGGATAALTYTHESDAEAIAEGARVDAV